MFSLLPPEISLDIVSDMTVYQIPSLRLVDSVWKQFVDVNENYIYRSAAIHHSFASPGSSLDRVTGNKSVPWLDGVASWKVLCRIYLQSPFRFIAHVTIS